MIVLAIAGLILAIVFIAVPALQRNSRDTQRRADVSALRSAVATYVGNTNGKIPESRQELGEALDGIDLKFYDAADYSATVPAATWLPAAAESTVFYASIDTAVAVQTTAVDPVDFVIYVEGAECISPPPAKSVFPAIVVNTAGTVITPGGARSYAVVYTLETGTDWSCEDNAT